jgi:hypothetical protein
MLYLYAAIPIILEVLLVVHVFRTGRDRWWIYIIFFVPMAGGIAYLLVEVLPDMIRGRGAAKVREGVTRVVNPGKRLKDAEAQLALAPTVQNKCALAEAWLEAGDPARAVSLYEQSLTGIYRQDRSVMAGLAHALAAAGNSAGAARVFEEIARVHGPLGPDRDILRYAACLDAAGDAARAEQAYRDAALKSAGLEARYRYLEFLHRAGRAADAEHQMKTMEQAWSLMPRFARRDQKEWMAAAQKTLVG